MKRRIAYRKEPTVEQMKCSMKKGHASERVAQRHAAACEPRAGQRLFTYRCPHCKLWHLTRSAPGAPKERRA